MESWYKLIIAYDGTDFFGWQWQNHKRTVEGAIKKTFLELFQQKHVYLVAASRTDAGVHARGQVIRIGTSLALEPQKLMMLLNNSLPHEISVLSCKHSLRSFHPQHQVSYKVYSYRVFTQRPMPYEQRYGYFFYHKLDMQKLNAAFQIFVGTHDFKRFSKPREGFSTIRTIAKIELIQDRPDAFIIQIAGVSFLHYMVRRMVGAALAIASDCERLPKEIKNILENDILSPKSLPKAPAKGLCLEKIVYEGESL